MTLRPALIALLLPALLPAVGQAARPFDARDMVTLDRVSSPTLSPDGRKLVVAVREVDYEANKASAGLWIEDLLARDAAPPVRFTAEAMSVNSPAFSPDGARVYFLSAQSGSQQLWRQDVAGGEAVQVTDFPLDIGSYKLSPDGKAVAVSLEVFPDCADLACTRSRLDEKAAAKTTGVVYDNPPLGKRFGQLISDAQAQYRVGQTAQAVSWRMDGKPLGRGGQIAWLPWPGRRATRRRQSSGTPAAKGRPTHTPAQPPAASPSGWSWVRCCWLATAIHQLSPRPTISGQTRSGPSKKRPSRCVWQKAPCVR